MIDKGRGGAIREQSASKVARISDFYRLDTDSGFLADDVDPLHLEDALSEIEGEAAHAWKQLINRGALDQATVARVAIFMAVWAYRTPRSMEFFRAEMGKYTPRHERDRAVVNWLRGDGTAAMLSVLSPAIRENAARFMEQRWQVVRPIDGLLIAADTPFLALGVTEEFLAQGLTPGFAVPVGPALLLLCGDWFIEKFDQDDIARQWNQTAVNHADSWLFARPGTVIQETASGMEPN